MGGHPAGKIGIADNLYSIVTLDDFIFLGQVTIAALFGARSITTEPGFISFTISAGHNLGAGRPGISAVVITMSTSAPVHGTAASPSMNSGEAGLA